MALTRKMLKAMGIEDEKIDQIIDAHSETVDGLKAKLDEARENGKALEDAKKELDAAKGELEAAKKDGWKDKYDALKKEFDGYKTEQTRKDTAVAKEKAVRAYLEGKNITGKNLELAVRACKAEIDAAELDGDKLKDTSALDDLVSGDFSGLVSKTEVKGANTHTPPANNGAAGKLTKEEIYKIKDITERQKAIAANRELFDF